MRRPRHAATKALRQDPGSQVKKSGNVLYGFFLMLNFLVPPSNDEVITWSVITTSHCELRYNPIYQSLFKHHFPTRQSDEMRVKTGLKRKLDDGNDGSNLTLTQMKRKKRGGDADTCAVDAKNVEASTSVCCSNY